MLKAVVTRPDKDCGMQLLRMRSDTYHQNCDAYIQQTYEKKIEKVGKKKKKIWNTRTYFDIKRRQQQPKKKGLNTTLLSPLPSSYVTRDTGGEQMVKKNN